MIEKHIKLIEQAAKKACKCSACRKFFTPVFLLRTGAQVVRVHRACAGRSDNQVDAALAKKHGMVLSSPVYEKRQLAPITILLL